MLRCEIICSNIASSVNPSTTGLSNQRFYALRNQVPELQNVGAMYLSISLQPFFFYQAKNLNTLFQQRFYYKFRQVASLIKCVSIKTDFLLNSSNIHLIFIYILSLSYFLYQIFVLPRIEVLRQCKISVPKSHSPGVIYY